jgi:hypothetical protein
MIYYHKYVDIPLVSFTEDDIWICLDRRITKQVLKLIRHFITNDIDFLLTNRLVIWRDVTEEDLPIILENYLRALSDEVFFDSIFDMGFDYIRNLTHFMIKYKCLDQLSETFDKIMRKHYMKEKTDWWTGSVYYLIKREDIRDFLSTLEREIKLNILI